MDSPNTESSLKPFPTVWLILVLLATLSLLFLPVPSPTFFWKSVTNSGHVPLFSVVGILLLKLSRVLLKRSNWSPIRHYVIAMSGVVFLALVTEGLQTLIRTRHPQVSDVIYDFLGAMCGLGLFLTYDASVLGKWALFRASPRNLIVRIGVGLVIAMAFLPVAEWTYAYWDRANRFPSLLQFSSDWEMKFVKTSNSDLQLVVPPVGWKNSSEDMVGRVVFHRKKYPGIRLEEPYPDWRKYTYLQLDIFSELPSSQSIVLRIDDIHYNNEHTNHFNRRIAILPGINHIKIPVDDIRLAPVGREMDLSEIKAVTLFTKHPPKEFSLYLDNIRLE